LSVAKGVLSRQGRALAIHARFAYLLAIPSEVQGGMSNFRSDPSLSVAAATTQRVVTGNNRVTFPIRHAALLDATLSVNKYVKTYEND
jgi:hypothetical protein